MTTSAAVQDITEALASEHGGKLQLVQLQAALAQKIPPGSTFQEHYGVGRLTEFVTNSSEFAIEGEGHPNFRVVSLRTHTDGHTSSIGLPPGLPAPAAQAAVPVYQNDQVRDAALEEQVCLCLLNRPSHTASMGVPVGIELRKGGLPASVSVKQWLAARPHLFAIIGNETVVLVQQPSDRKLQPAETEQQLEPLPTVAPSTSAKSGSRVAQPGVPEGSSSGVEGLSSEHEQQLEHQLVAFLEGHKGPAHLGSHLGVHCSKVLHVNMTGKLLKFLQDWPHLFRFPKPHYVELVRSNTATRSLSGISSASAPPVPPPAPPVTNRKVLPVPSAAPPPASADTRPAAAQASLGGMDKAWQFLVDKVIEDGLLLYLAEHGSPTQIETLQSYAAEEYGRLISAPSVSEGWNAQYFLRKRRALFKVEKNWVSLVEQPAAVLERLTRGGPASTEESQEPAVLLARAIHRQVAGALKLQGLGPSVLPEEVQASCSRLQAQCQALQQQLAALLGTVPKLPPAPASLASAPTASARATPAVSAATQPSVPEAAPATWPSPAPMPAPGPAPPPPPAASAPPTPPHEQQALRNSAASVTVTALPVPSWQGQNLNGMQEPGTPSPHAGEDHAPGNSCCQQSAGYEVSRESSQDAQEVTAAAAVEEGSLVLMGGHDGEAWMDSCELITPATGAWQSLPLLAVPRAFAAAAAFMGQIYLVGGGNGVDWFDSVLRYDMAAPGNGWAEVAALRGGRGSLAAGRARGALYAFGGGQPGEQSNATEWFDHKTNQWLYGPTLTTKRFALGGAVLNDTMYAVGGFDGVSYLTSAERLDPRIRRWEVLNGSMKVQRSALACAACDNRIFVVGGYDGGGAVAEVEAYDVRAGRWLQCESMVEGRAYGAAVTLDGQVYAVGGLTSDMSTHAHSFLQSYNPVTDTWQDVPLAANAPAMRSFVTACNFE